MKPVRFVGSSLEDLKGFPKDARRQAGFELDAVQRGREPSDWKPMKTVGPAVREIRIHIGGEHRVIYVARFADAVYVLHAFRKKTRKTSQRDLDVAQQRYKWLKQERGTSR